MAGADEDAGSDEGLPPNLGRSAVVMAVGTTLSRVTGLGRLVAMAYALGVSEFRLADSYNVANTMPNVLYELILGGVLTSVFIPVLVEELRRKRDDDTGESVSALVTTSIVAVLAITVLAVIGAPWIIRLFTFRLSGAEQGAQQELATFFLRIFAPQIIELVFGPDFAPAVPALRAFAFVLPLGITAGLLSVLWLLPRGLDWASTRIVLMSGALNVVLVLVLVPRFGIEAAAWSLVVIELFTITGWVWTIRRAGIYGPRPPAPEKDPAPSPEPAADPVGTL